MKSNLIIIQCEGYIFWRLFLQQSASDVDSLVRINIAGIVIYDKAT